MRHVRRYLIPWLMLLLVAAIPFAEQARAAFSFWKISELFSFAGWIGNYSKIGAWETTDESYGVYTGDGGFSYPLQPAVDATNGYVYVPDQYGNRVVKMNLATGAFVGWIGSIATTGGTCTAGVGVFTGGWCTGGTAGPGSSVLGGFEMPQAVAVDATNGYLYVTEYTYRVQKFNLATGAFVGWMGKNGSTGNFTGGWTTANTYAAMGTGDGMFFSPQGMAVDATNGYFYVADTYNHRIQKFNLATGAFIGWIGAINTTGGTCTAGVGSFTGGWCSGGTSASGTGDGMMNRPATVLVDPVADALYVLDSANYRIMKFKASSGTFDSWIGVIGTTGGTCTAGVGVFSGGWCAGGAAGVFSSDEAAITNSAGMAIDLANGYLYATENGWHGSIKKYNLSTGAYIGWLGQIGSLGGSCTAGVGLFSGGWCTGGSMTRTANQINGQIYAGGLAYGGGYLIETDGWLSRVQKFNASTGASLGVSGAYAVAKSPWATSTTLIRGGGPGDGILGGFSGNTFMALAADPAGGYLYVNDAGNYRVQKFNLATGAA
jgi:hypothetical protein